MKLSLESFLSAIDRGWKSMHAVCGLRTCQNTLLMRSVPESRVGVRVGQLWYCSVDCFAKAAGIRYSAFSGGRIMEMPHNPRLSLGFVMLSKGYLTEEQLRLAATQSQLSGEELDVSLIRHGLVSERQLAAARAAQWGYPVLGPDCINQPVDADIPVTLLRMFTAVPLHYSVTAKRLLVGFVYRVEHSLLHSLEQVTGCRAEPCFITPTEFREQMACLTATPNCKEVVFEDPLTPAEMAKTVGGFAVEVDAREASFEQCQNYLWIRLSGRRRMIDVLFRGRNAAEARKNAIFLASGERVSSLG